MIALSEASITWWLKQTHLLAVFCRKTTLLFLLSAITNSWILRTIMLCFTVVFISAIPSVHEGGAMCLRVRVHAPVVCVCMFVSV